MQRQGFKWRRLSGESADDSETWLQSLMASAHAGKRAGSDAASVLLIDDSNEQAETVT